LEVWLDKSRKLEESAVLLLLVCECVLAVECRLDDKRKWRYNRVDQ